MSAAVRETPWLADPAAADIKQDMVREATEPRRRKKSEAWREALESPPTEGIPQRVFQEASQSRRLQRARESSHGPFKDDFPEDVRRLLDSQEKPRVGRPPARPLNEKLQILHEVEKAFATGRNLDEVAKAHYMSRSALRDLIFWARHVAQPVLFTNLGQGTRGGQLTPAARRLLGRQSEERHNG